jgi:hypothetical protein
MLKRSYQNNAVPKSKTGSLPKRMNTILEALYLENADARTLE